MKKDKCEIKKSARIPQTGKYYKLKHSALYCLDSDRGSYIEVIYKGMYRAISIIRGLSFGKDLTSSTEKFFIDKFCILISEEKQLFNSWDKWVAEISERYNKTKIGGSI